MSLPDSLPCGDGSQVLSLVGRLGSVAGVWGPVLDPGPEMDPCSGGGSSEVWTLRLRL